MAAAEPPSFVYDTLSPLLGHDDLSCDSLSGKNLLYEAPDVSPNTKFSNRKLKIKKSISAMEADEELRFLKKARVSSPEPWLERVPTVLRREIGDPEDTMCSESSDGEIEYLSLEVSGSNSLEDPNAEPVTPLTISPVEDKLKAVIEFPWSDSHKKITSPLLLLHQEIIDFCHFLSPTPEEQAARLAAIGRVSEVIKFIWPNCEVKVFGSFETGLYLPISDIDVVILNSNVQVPQNGLQALAKALSKRSIATKMQVIGKARVPIIKFIEKESNVAFDISFDVQNGPEAAKFIKDAISKIPPLRPLCLILKIFLQQRELNEVYSGGIGSYALLVMLITHLQVHWSRQCSTGRSKLLECNLGILLIDFFDLYGRKLNAHDVGVSCRFGGQFFRKNRRGFLNPKRPHLLSVEDPQAPENDIGKNSYNILQVRAAFVMAYRKLTETDIDDLISSQNSILGRIIKIDAKLLERVGRLMKGPQSDAFLATRSDHALRYISDSDADETALHPLMKNQGFSLNRWQLCDDEPLPRGQPSANSGLKRKWNEGKRHAKRFKRKNDNLRKHFSPSAKNFTTQNSEGHKSKKRKNESVDEVNSPTRHGVRYKKSKISSVKVEHKHLISDYNNNFGARTTSNFHAAKYKYS